MTSWVFESGAESYLRTHVPLFSGEIPHPSMAGACVAAVREIGGVSEVGGTPFIGRAVCFGASPARRRPLWLEEVEHHQPHARIALDDSQGEQQRCHVVIASVEWHKHAQTFCRDP